MYVYEESSRKRIKIYNKIHDMESLHTHNTRSPTSKDALMLND